MAKRILITGEHSYIGNAVAEYLEEYNRKQGKDLYEITKVSLRNGTLQELSFAGYDAVLHVAGIAHADVGGVSEEEQKQYFAINSDLAYETAKKACAEGIAQFIYLSSVIVYGDSAPVGKEKKVDRNTPLSPANFYGESKQKGEEKLKSLQADRFQVAIVRPPMVYGKGSKGNFPLLAKLAGMTFLFPEVKNERSMIYIENLAEFFRLLVEKGCGGIFLPQNSEYVNTSQMVALLRRAMGKRMHLCSILGFCVKLCSKLPGKVGRLVNKAFGSLTIDLAVSKEGIDGYQLYSLEESIRKIYED